LCVFGCELKSSGSTKSAISGTSKEIMLSSLSSNDVLKVKRLVNQVAHELAKIRNNVSNVLGSIPSFVMDFIARDCNKNDLTDNIS
jgi:hypothetical protein